MYSSYGTSVIGSKDGDVFKITHFIFEVLLRQPYTNTT